MQLFIHLKKVNALINGKNRRKFMRAENTNVAKPKMAISQDVGKICDSIIKDLKDSSFPIPNALLHLFTSSGKCVRPNILVQLSYLLNSKKRHDCTITPRQISIAKFAEMVHVASLIHDDVIDASKERRGKGTLHCMYGDRNAVLTGDYIISKATFLVSQLNDPILTSILTRVIYDLVVGEITQLKQNYEYSAYIDRCRNKTSSLIASTCKSLAHVIGAPDDVIEDMYLFGEYVGLSFQIIDDCLDFDVNEELGKPKLNDLKNGLVTLPVIFAAQKFPIINEIICKELENTDVNIVKDLVLKSGSIDLCKLASKEMTDKAAGILVKYQDNIFSRTLIEYLYSLHSRKK